MKRIVLITLCAFFALTTFAQSEKKKNNKETVLFSVEGMHCNNCVKKIEKNISFEKGVTDLKCDLETKTAEITYRSDKTNEEKLIAAFKKIGMDAIQINENEKAKESQEHNHSH